MPTNKSGNAGIYDAYDDRPDFEPWKPTKAAPKDVAWAWARARAREVLVVCRYA